MHIIKAVKDLMKFVGFFLNKQQSNVTAQLYNYNLQIILFHLLNQREREGERGRERERRIKR